MSTYYVDYDGAAGSGNGSSFANRAKRIRDVGYTIYGGDEIRIKGRAPTSVGTIDNAIASRGWMGPYGSLYFSAADVVYSTTTGQSYIKEVGLGNPTLNSQGAGGWQTGDRIFIINDPSASPNSEPSLAGIWEVTVTNSYDDVNGKVYLNGYTANTNRANPRSDSLYYVVLNPDVVKLNTSNITKVIASTDPNRSAWTSAGTATTSISGNTSAWQSSGVENIYAEGCDKIEVPSSQAVGKVAHYQLPSSLDLSGYQQISFMIRSDADDFTTPDEIRLCTDTAGNTSVHTAPIKLRKSHDQCWVASVTDLGANMNASIQSIALYRAASQSAQCTYRIQNVIACKASSANDSITHKSLVGLNDGIWYNICWIVDDFLCVKGNDSFKGAKWTYYDGGAGVKWKTQGSAVTMYKVEPFYPLEADLQTTNGGEYDKIQWWNNSGPNFATISGGWNSTDMSTSDSVTILQGNNQGIGIHANGKHYVHWKDLYVHGFDRVIEWRYSNNYKLEDCGFAHNRDQYTWIYSVADWHMLKLDYVMGQHYWDNCTQKLNINRSDFEVRCILTSPDNQGFQWNRTYDSNLLSTSSRDLKFELIDASYCAYNDGVSISNARVVEIGTADFSQGYYAKNISPSGSNSIVNIGTLNMDYCGYLYHSGQPGKPFNITTISADIPTHPTSPTTEAGRRHGIRYQVSDIRAYSYGTGEINISGGTFAGALKCTNGGEIKVDNVALGDYYQPLIRQISESGSNIQLRSYDQVSGDNRYYSAGHTFTPETSVRNTASGYSLKAEVRSTTEPESELTLGSIVVNGGSAVTVSLYVYTPSNETITLKVPGVSYMGVAEQTVTSSGVSANTWTQISKTFTPTASGKLDIIVVFTNNNSSSVMYIDDFGVSQV